MNYCQYYQADVKRSECWFFVGIMRSYENMSFDRTLKIETSTFEFFVPDAMEERFLKVMEYFQNNDIVQNLKKLPNRLTNPNETIA